MQECEFMKKGSPLLDDSSKSHAFKGVWREAAGRQEVTHLRLLSQLQDCRSAPLENVNPSLTLTPVCTYGDASTELSAT